ncbi:MAG: NAD(+)/NADH kinase, partial [Acidobacteriota bacterium]
MTRTDSLLSPCVVVVKTPVAVRDGMADRLVESGRPLALEVTGAAHEHERTLAVLYQTLAELGVEPFVVSVDALDARARRAIGRARLVITAGGDGTLLSASQWVSGAAVLGINSAPSSSVGYLSVARRATIARTLARIDRGTLVPQAVTRLEVEIGGKILPPALNDVLIAHDRPAATSRYRLFFGRKSERHRSSG